MKSTNSYPRCALALLLASGPAPVLAAAITVNSLDDSQAAGDSVCTLREAVSNANANSDTTGGDCAAGSGADSIGFSGTGTIALSDALPVIAVTDAAELTIDGADAITVSGNGTRQVLRVSYGAILHVQKLIVADAYGAIDNNGKLTIDNSRISGNRYTGSVGAISNNSGAFLSVANSTFSDNLAWTYGGAISNNGTLTVTRSTFSRNSARAAGGAISNFGSLTVSNSTFSGNTSAGAGGGIFNYGILSLFNSTFSRNSVNSAGSGGAIYNVGALDLVNTILADSTVGGDCVNSGTLATNLNSLSEDGSCSPAYTGDPVLGPLADNGGPTQTHALLAGSPAIDAGDDARCAAAPVSNLDQRGVSRPQGAHCDIGAFELVFPADLSVSLTDAPDPVLVGGSLLYTVTVTNAGVGAASGVVLTDTLPAGAAFVSADSTQGSCTANSGLVTCELGALANGANATVTIRVTPTAAGTLTNPVEVNGDQFDEHPDNNTASADTTVNAPPSAPRLIYGVQDSGGRDSQFFTIDETSHAVQLLGPLNKGWDIETLDLQRSTGTLYAAAGADNAYGKKGYLFTVNRDTGALTPVGPTGYKSVAALSFRPTDNRLWGWAQGKGLITVNPATGTAQSVLKSGLDVQGLAWSNDGSRLYAAVGFTLWVYTPAANRLNLIAINLPFRTEALEMRPDGLLALGVHGSTRIQAYNPVTRQWVPNEAIPTGLNDVEGIAWPEVSTSP